MIAPQWNNICGYQTAIQCCAADWAWSGVPTGKPDTRQDSDVLTAPFPQVYGVIYNGTRGAGTHKKGFLTITTTSPAEHWEESEWDTCTYAFQVQPILQYSQWMNSVISLL